MVSQMIALYCRRNHHTKGVLCPERAALNDYARARSEHCPFMETKTFCVNCRVHCYKPDMREKDPRRDALFRPADNFLSPRRRNPPRGGDKARKKRDWRKNR